MDMSLEVPNDFVSLHETEVHLDNEVNVIAIVVDYLPPRKTNGIDWQLSLGIQDPSFLSSINGRSGLRVKFFKPESKLPKISGIGDVVLLRRVRRGQFNGAPLLKSGYATETLVFPAAKIPDPSFTAAYISGHRVIDHFRMPDTARNPSDSEQQYVIALRSWGLENLDFQSIPTAPRTSLQSNATLSPKPAFSGPKLRSLKDIHCNGYYDLVGEVVRVWTSSCYTTIYWTDYTSNKLVQSIASGDEPTNVQRDGDPYGYTEGMSIKRKAWPGPTGKMCLQIFLWPPHSIWANNNITEKDLVFIKNVRIGTRKDMEFLRADLNEDPKHPDQIDIRKLATSDPRCKEFLEHREKYWQQQEEECKPSEQLSRKEKKMRRKEKERALKASKSAKQVNSRFPDDEENTNVEPHYKKPLVPKVNPHVACTHLDQPLLSITDVLDPPTLFYRMPSGQDIKLPFLNQKCRIRARVLDFWPSQLEDFARPVTIVQDDGYHSSSQGYSMGNIQTPTWEWAFVLSVEDANKPPPGQIPAKMNLVVSNKEAEYLLKLDATDLRNNPKVLSNLRETLFIMWGNLEELKRNGQFGERNPSSMAFECCIMEYGVRQLHGWQRLHKMFETTIKA